MCCHCENTSVLAFQLMFKIPAVARFCLEHVAKIVFSISIISTQVINASSNILIYTFVGNSFREQFVKMFQITILFCNVKNVFQRWKLGQKNSNWLIEIYSQAKHKRNWFWQYWDEPNDQEEADWWIDIMNSLFFLGVENTRAVVAKAKYDSSCNKPLVQ